MTRSPPITAHLARVETEGVATAAGPSAGQLQLGGLVDGVADAEVHRGEVHEGDEAGAKQPTMHSVILFSTFLTLIFNS